MLFCAVRVRAPPPPPATHPLPVAAATGCSACLPYSRKRRAEKGALIKTTSWDLEEKGVGCDFSHCGRALRRRWGWLLCKRPHRASLSSPLASIPQFLRLLASFGLMSLLLNIRGLFFIFIFLIFVLVIKPVFLFFSLSVSPCLSVAKYLPSSCLSWLSRGIAGKKRDRGICVPAGWEAQLKFSHLEYIQRA